MPALSSEEIRKTCVRLHQRIVERFPDSGLSKTCESLATLSEEADNTIAWIGRPNHVIRYSAWLVIALLIASLIRTCVAFHVTFEGMNIADFFQMIDAGFNSVVLLGAAGIFLMTFEIRRKRRRVISSVNKLRSIAHIVDAHQLLKDPNYMAEKRTPHSPDRDLGGYELGRYLDYCSEMLSLCGKIAFLYVQDFDDADANEAVNDLESLTIGLSQKIWQKIVILNSGDN